MMKKLSKRAQKKKRVYRKKRGINWNSIVIILGILLVLLSIPLGIQQMAAISFGEGSTKLTITDIPTGSAVSLFVGIVLIVIGLWNKKKR